MNRSPRLLWAFGGAQPCDELHTLLEQEGIDSGALLAEAFCSFDRLQFFAEQNRCSAQATSQLALAWTRAHSAADSWARCGPRISKVCAVPLCSGAVSSGNLEVFSAKSLEDKALSAALDRAVALAWRVGLSAGLLPELLSELKDNAKSRVCFALFFWGQVVLSVLGEPRFGQSNGLRNG